MASSAVGRGSFGATIEPPEGSAEFPDSTRSSAPIFAQVVLTPMESFPARDGSFDLVIARGIWNLAPSAAQFRRAIGEAARAKPRAGLFVFTFARNTFPTETEPVVVGGVVFAPEQGVPFREYRRPQSATLPAGTLPVIYEAAFRRT